MKNEEANKQKKGEGMIRKLPTPLIVGLILAVGRMRKDRKLWMWNPGKRWKRNCCRFPIP